MKKLLTCLVLSFITVAAFAQSAKTELYDLVKKLICDSTGYENIGDWSVGQPKRFPVKWKADKIEMSEDTSINFYRLGTANIAIKGRIFTQAGQPVKWNIMLKGPRSGYSSFSILSTPCSVMQPKYTFDSLFGNNSFKQKMIKGCDTKPFSGFYYYELKLPKKDAAFIKIGWISINGNTAIRIDCFDNWSKYAAKIDCSK